MELRGAAWYAAWCCVVLRGAAWCCVVLRGAASMRESYIRVCVICDVSVNGMY